MIAKLTNKSRKFFVPYNGLSVSWFDKWHPVLDEALKTIPEVNNYSWDLYRLISRIVAWRRNEWH